MRTDRYKEEPKKKRGRILKILLLLIILLLVAIPASAYYSYKSTLDSLSVKFKDKDMKLEVESDVPISSCIESYTGDISLSHEGKKVDYKSELPTDTIGQHKITAKVSSSMFGGLLKPEKEFSMQYSVEDNTDPVMLWSGDGVVLEKGTEFDIKSVVGYGDNADPKPEIKYDGDVDMDKEGSYPLHITVTDASGNSIEWDMSVTVAESIPTYADDGSRFAFSDLKKSYAGEGRKFGLDVSSWQEDIDFKKVKKAGCEFVFIRAGFSEDGKVTIDNTFEQNIKRAREEGVPVGLYLYSYDNSEEDVRKAAKWIVEQLGGEKLDYPIAFDWEDFGQFQQYEMSFITLNRMYDAFADELSKAGYDCMLYGSLNFLEKVWENTDTRPVWLAHYAEQTDYKGPYKVWQLSSIGKIDGISGPVDLDIMYE